MKPSTVGAIFFSAAASGAAIERSYPTDRHFQIKGFYASCTPHSLYCNMEFNVATTRDGPTTECSFYGVGPDYLPDIPLTGCKDPNVSFKYARAYDDNLAKLSIVTADTPKKNTTGTHTIPKDQFYIRDGGSVQDEFYTGPKKFQIKNLSTKAI